MIINSDFLDEYHISELEDKLTNPSEGQYHSAIDWLFKTYLNIWYNKSNVNKRRFQKGNYLVSRVIKHIAIINKIREKFIVEFQVYFFKSEFILSIFFEFL